MRECADFVLICLVYSLLWGFLLAENRVFESFVGWAAENGSFRGWF